MGNDRHDDHDLERVTLVLDRASIRYLDAEADKLSTRLARPSRSAIARDILAGVRAGRTP